MSYSVGGGLEFIALRALGISIEGGYGKVGVDNAEGISTSFIGLGLHYYIQ